MSYGFELLNENGRTLIDGINKQVQILKEGYVDPRPISTTSSNPARGGSAINPVTAKPTAIMLPGDKDKTVIFMRPQKIGTGTEASTMNCGIQEGDCTVTWTLTSSVSSGQNFALASISVGSNIIHDLSTPTMSVNSGLQQSDTTKDYIGDTLSGWAGFSGKLITKVENQGSGVYKITFDGNSTASISSGTTATVLKHVAWFWHSDNERTMAYGSASNLTNYKIQYKMGTITEDEEETGTYGLQVFRSDGSLAYSSNREQFQILEVRQGRTDLIHVPYPTLGEWETGSSGRAITVKKEVADLDHAWVLVTSMGKCNAFVYTEGSGSSRARVEVVAGVGYIWSNIGYNFFDNKSHAGMMDTGIQATISCNTNTVGVCISPMEMNKKRSIIGTAPVSFSDTWSADGYRTLLTGKFL